jgi:hypothetical protein
MGIDHCAPELLWKGSHSTWYWYIPQILLALGAMVLAWLGTAGLVAIWKRASILLLEMVVAFVVWVFISIWYIDTYRPIPTMVLSLNQRAGGDGGIPCQLSAERAWPAELITIVGA